MSQVPKVEAAYQRIAALGVPILGAVVSGHSKSPAILSIYGMGLMDRSSSNATALAGRAIRE